MLHSLLLLLAYLPELLNLMLQFLHVIPECHFVNFLELSPLVLGQVDPHSLLVPGINFHRGDSLGSGLCETGAGCLISALLLQLSDDTVALLQSTLVLGV